jgi:hypothetical protein
VQAPENPGRQDGDPPRPAITLKLRGEPVEQSLLLSTGEGPPRQLTTVSVRATEWEFSVSFVCEDTDAWGTFTGRDDPLYLEECVELFLAPGEADPTDYFEFEVSPLGTLFDAKIHNPIGRRETMTADVIWNAAGTACHASIAKHLNQWTADLVVPWADLGFPDPQALFRVWRLNFYRIDRPRDGSSAEFSCWSPTLETPANFHLPARFGLLHILG